LGLTGVVAESFARIHKANLCNFGLWPLELVTPADRARLWAGHRLRLSGLDSSLKPGAELTLADLDTGEPFKVRLDVSARQLEMLLAGGLLALEAARGDPAAGGSRPSSA
jgi:aconitate hydratase